MQKEGRRGEDSGRRGRRVWLAAVAVVALVAAAVYGFWVLRDRRSADERLAEIEAARAVPDGQNAALIYNELLQDPSVLSVIDSRPDFLNGTLFCKRRDEPWHSEGDPEVAAWIAKWTPVVENLTSASQLNTCCFPISIALVLDEATMDRRRAMREWTTLLRFAISNDLGDGRLHDAVTKWRCLVQMGNHLRQQPYLLDHMTAYGSRLALAAMARFVVEDNPSPELLREIEAMPVPLADDWKQHLKQIRLIERLVIRKMKEPFSLWDRLRYPIDSYRMERAVRQVYPDEQESPTESTAHWYRQDVAAARGLRILVALRRHRSETGQWPESLAEISSSLPETILTDPLNGGSFVYHRTAEAFELYSKGRNKIDETMRRGSDHGDDWLIWPPRESPAQRKPADANGVQAGGG